MAEDGGVRDNFKTVRYSDAEYALIAEAASLTRTRNPSKVIRDGAVARAREIVENHSRSREERSDDAYQRFLSKLSAIQD